jgi:NAD(P)-dependent dehydrogenase (short-subunit alcohol dehydrogenase family)
MSSTDPSSTDLSGSTAIVTGASRGFGRATAVALAANGAHVVGVSRSEAALGELHQQLGTSFTPVGADVGDTMLAARLLAAYRPRTLVLNAGATPHPAPLSEQTWKTFSQNWEVDVQQVFQFAREALLMPLDPGAAVVSLSSGAALRGSPMSGGYAGAKATIKFISSYAGSEAERNSLGIRFLSVLPQLTPATDLGSVYVDAYAAYAGLSRETYLGQFGSTLTVEQVAESIVELATDDGYTAPAYLLTASGVSPLD